jgi:hypothetical protein
VPFERPEALKARSAPADVIGTAIMRQDRHGRDRRLLRVMTKRRRHRAGHDAHSVLEWAVVLLIVFEIAITFYQIAANRH